MVVFRFVLGNLDRLGQPVNRLIEVDTVDLGALLQVFDGEVIGVAGTSCGNMHPQDRHTIAPTFLSLSALQVRSLGL